MGTSTTIRLSPGARIAAPEWADAYLDVSDEGSDLSLFLGWTDDERVANADKIIEALHDIRIRCLARIVKSEPEQADPITAAKAAAAQ